MKRYALLFTLLVAGCNGAVRPKQIYGPHSESYAPTVPQLDEQEYREEFVRLTKYSDPEGMKRPSAFRKMSHRQQVHYFNKLSLAHHYLAIEFKKLWPPASKVEECEKLVVDSMWRSKRAKAVANHLQNDRSYRPTKEDFALVNPVSLPEK